MTNPRLSSHDAIVEWLVEERSKTNLERISNAFVASLSTRRLDLRSALGSYAFAECFPLHKLAQAPQRNLPSGNVACDYCGYVQLRPPKDEDMSYLSQERAKYGGIRHNILPYPAYDLEQFRALSVPQPTQEDIFILRRILNISDSMPADAGPNALEKALTGVFRSNKYERRTLIQILGFCGILQPRDKSGYFGEFTFAFEETRPHDHTNDWSYPIIWWQGSDGVNETAVRHYFPML
ncbi:MAG: hypothetical protein VR75_02620 [Hyphomonadaceae bacterium BRH_c29]|nr:MAG: hypothetical protein VR75_02620 [Hyphomonadaceae bacterium BRH_c29]